MTRTCVGWRLEESGVVWSQCAASALTHLLEETETPGFTGESVWPHPTSGRYASVMRSAQIRGRSGEQKMMSVGRLSVGCAGEKSPPPLYMSAGALCWLKASWLSQLQVWKCVSCCCSLPHLNETALQNIRKGGRVWFIKCRVSVHVMAKQMFV